MTLEEANEYIKKKMVCTDYPKQKTFVDISGIDVNYLHVIKYVGRDKYHLSYFLCQCVCGEYTVVSGYDLRHQQIKSCGCRNKEFINNEVHLKHGDSKRGNKSHLYMIWCDMKYRCTNPKSYKYHRYGGRGIKLCDEWLDTEHGYDNFKRWAYENGYKDGLSIERIDVSLGYFPENCTWITMYDQQFNRQATKFGVIGRYAFPLSVWAKIVNIKESTLYGRINRYKWDIVDAILTPPDCQKGEHITEIYIPEEYMKYNKFEVLARHNKIPRNSQDLSLKIYNISDENIN